LDEAYADYAENNLLLEAVASERLLVLRTFSKLYGLAGLRVGFGVGPVELITEVEKARGPYKVNALAERAAAAAIEDTSGWAARIAMETVENRERLEKELKSRGLNPLPSQANFLLIPMGFGAGEAAEGFPGVSAREMNDRLRRSGVAGRPFSDLDAIGDALRVSIGPWEQMTRFLEALDTALAMGGRSK
jgi:histidinol-phosphate/aromatic aminotransferase/cobyric acid decarboxylase-like protein